MLNPESVMLNLFQHLFRAGLFQHLKSIHYYSNVKVRISPIRKYQIELFNDLSLKESSIPRREPSRVKI